MNGNRNQWGISALIVALFLGMYGLSCYTSIYDRRISYLYDPISDDIYSVELAPSLSKYWKWGDIPVQEAVVHEARWCSIPWQATRADRGKPNGHGIAQQRLRGLECKKRKRV